MIQIGISSKTYSFVAIAMGFLLSFFVCTAYAQAGGEARTNPSGTLVANVTWTELDHADQNLAFLEKTKQSLVGSRVDDARLGQLMSDLTKQLRDEGYLIGQVAVTIGDRETFFKTGQLRLSIFLGRVGAIEVKNSSAINTEWVDQVASNAVCPNGVGDQCILTKARFERMTRLLQDTLGLHTESVNFSPDGVAIGQTKMIIVTVSTGDRLKGSLGIDNQGFSSTGRYRLGGTATMGNVLGVGDAYSLSLFSSNKGAVSGAFDVSGPLSANGLRWQSSIGRSQFFVPNVNTNGFGNSLSACVAYPLVRGLDANWTTSLNAVGVITNAENFGVTTTNKTLTSGQLTLDGNSGDRSIVMGQHSWYVRSALTMGHVGDTGVLAGSNAPLGPYTKFAFQGVAKLVLNEQHNIYSTLNVRGQAANTNLDPYEKMLIGGFSGMRAYYPEEGSFNQGTITTLELRQAINTPYGQFIPVIFMDYANGWINHATYANWQTQSGYSNSGLSNHLALSDAGLGLDWAGLYGLNLSLSWARRLPSSPAAMNGSGNSNSQFWFVAQARF